MFEVRETKRTKQLQLFKDGELVQKVCKSCGFPKLIDDFKKYSNENLRPDCSECHTKAQSKYMKKIAEKRKVYKQRQRARELGLPDNYTDEDYTALKAFSSGVCMLSGNKDDSLQIDHFMALSKRGLGSTKGNLILVSEKVNQAKRDMNFFDFLKSDRSRGLIDKTQLFKTMRYLAEANEMTLAQYIQFLKDMEELAHNAKNLWR